MCKFSSKSGGGGGVPFQSLGDLTWNDPRLIIHTFGCVWLKASKSPNEGVTQDISL